MFAEWISNGAIFGIEAFFAVFTFLMFCGAVLGILGILARIIGHGGDDEE